MSSPRFLSSFKSYEVRTFFSNIKCNKLNNFDINIKVKEWMEKNEKHIFEISLSNYETIFYEKEYCPCIKISGFVEDENINDHDVFEKIYHFFEYLFIELNLPFLSFVFQNKVYKISKPIKNLKI